MKIIGVLFFIAAAFLLYTSLPLGWGGVVGLRFGGWPGVVAGFGIGAIILLLESVRPGWWDRRFDDTFVGPGKEMAMARSKATTVKGYLDELPPDQRKALTQVRQVVNKNLPKGYKESLMFGMIGWGIPLSRFPDTYNGQPLCYAGLAAQKNYNALYLMTAYGDPKLRAMLVAGFKKAGKKLDMGKSCIRFRTVDDLPLDTIAQVVASVPADKYIAVYEKSRRGRS